MRRLFATVLIAGAVTPVLAGCGASNAIDPAVVANAADKTASAGGARMTMAVQVRGRTLTGSGLLDMRGRRFQMTMQLPGQGSLEMRLIDQVMYMRLPGRLRQSLPGGKTWAKIDLQKALKSKGIDLQSLQSATGGNPSDQLEQLRGAGRVQRVGKETVRGASTTHYTATVDLRKAAKNAKARQSVERLIKLGGPTTVPIDVWLDDQGRVRRERFQEKINGESASGTIELYGFGDRQAIVTPSGGDTADITDQAAKAPTG